MPSKPTALHALVNKKTLIIEFTGSLALIRERKDKLPNPKDYIIWTTTEKKVGDSIRTISPETLKKIAKYYRKNMRKGVDTAEEI